MAGCAVVVTCWGGVLRAQSGGTLDQRIQKMMARPEFAHSRFGIEFIEAGTGEVIYELNAQELFVPGSTTKLLTAGTARAFLGDDFRFHTRVYRTGPIGRDGTLEGDLVLVASGDLNLSNRVQPDDTLAFENEDHSYGGPDSKGLPGDPLQVIRELAKQVAAKGIRRVTGRVLVDATLFPEGEPELGTGVVISPIVVNDNVIDVVVGPGGAEGSPVQVRIAPQTAYVTILNRATTGKAGSAASLKYRNQRLNADGSRIVALTGSLPLGAKPRLAPYPVPEPSRFATTVMVEALREQGIASTLVPPGDSIAYAALAANYTPDKVVGEHVSPPFKEDVKVTLKVSQNLHASTMPFLLGALVAHKHEEVDQAGFDLENGLLTKAGLDLHGMAQGDGAGGDAFYTPDFMVHYLLFLSRQKDFPEFYRALPVLGRDGTLFRLQVNSPAAGHVHAKTGTDDRYDAVNRRTLLAGKGLAGYMDTASGQHLIFALYLNMFSVPLDDPEESAGQVLGEIAAAAYDAPLPPRANVSK
jgi:D-alanyl-D-alanine carboxypeptidase/D-alanyl-D-alanine-endopeptidase (penicillin-binding protein 4)